MNKFELLERAKNFAFLLCNLDHKSVITKDNVESYHAGLESSIDNNFAKFEDSFVNESTIFTKEKYYIRLVEFLEEKK